jgi:hypothetical protein
MSLNVEPPEIATAVDVVDVHAPSSSATDTDGKETGAASKEASVGHLDASGSGSSDDDGESFQASKNPFLDPDVAAYWRGVYDNASYECRHVFDPTFTWSEEEERKLVRRLDLRVCLWACVMFFGLQVDRGNLVQAVSGNLLPELGLTTNGEYSRVNDS